MGSADADVTLPKSSSCRTIRGSYVTYGSKELATDDRIALWLLPFGHKDTVIAEWPIETDTTDTESEDAGNPRVLLSFHHEGKGNPQDVIQKAPTRRRDAHETNQCVNRHPKGTPLTRVFFW